MEHDGIDRTGTPPMPAGAAQGPAIPAPPPVPEPSRTGARVAIAVTLAVILLVTAYALANRRAAPGVEAGVYRGHGVTFTVPPGWVSLGQASFEAETGDQQWTEGFGVEPGTNAVIVSEYALGQAVTEADSAAVAAELETLFASVVQEQGGEITSPLTSVTVDGLPAFHVAFTGEVDGTPHQTEITVVFRDTQQWNIQCQSDGSHRADVSQGCELISSSFAVEP